MSGTIDLTAYIRRKRMSECTHEFVEVDDSAASLTCVECGAEIDPWWFLRNQAAHFEAQEAQRAKQREQYEAWCRNANEKAARLQSEIVQLTEQKNRLWNTQIDGRPLGVIARRRRS